MALGIVAKQLLTAAAVNFSFFALKRLATIQELEKSVGEQNIDKKFADFYSAKFAKEHGLKYDLVYDDKTNSVNFYKDTPVISGPSAELAKSRKDKPSLTDRLVPERKMSIDTVAARLHELGHVKDNKGLSKLRIIAPNLAAFMGPAIGQTIASGIYDNKNNRNITAPKPLIGAALTALAYVPLLLDEWKANKYAKDFILKHVAPDEADQMIRILNRSFRSYLYGTAASTAAVATYGFLRKKGII